MGTLAGAHFWDDESQGEAKQENTEAEPPLAQPVEMPPDAEEYLPPDPRPDQAGGAAEADVAEQAAEVPEDESDDYR